ncbi:LysR family transcriptional regulator [Pseudomonas syringae]|uniref:helix-turn-helix domain-containing protein n=1 Tax=Pseudomonas syringae TaxID=317 RepID=UPI000F00FCC4|nr:LysR family transcriptional regulator [Pseudomonas syringae]
MSEFLTVWSTPGRSQQCSFASAAQALDMTPSDVSRAVQRFENRLGIRVFDRTTRAVSLTDEGQSYSSAFP